MKTSEFRIGNHVNNGTVIEIHDSFITCTGHYNAVGMTSFQWNEIKPELLTEKWLLKFGFVEEDHKEYYLTHDERLFGGAIEPMQDGLKSPLPLHIWDASYTGANCHYVHQLQNLFFALTGKELEIK